MTDFDNKEMQGQEPPVPQPETPPQTPEQTVQNASQEAPQQEAQQPTANYEAPPQAGPSTSQVPHLTFDPNEEAPFQGDPFQYPEPPHAPEPPRPEPDYQQPPQYQPPQYTQPPQPTYYQPQYNVPPAGYAQKSRLAAGLLGILFGSLGIHNFYLGFTTRGVVQLLVSLIGGVITCGLATLAIAIWGFVEGVLLLTASPSRMYDGHGVILRD